MTPAVDESLVIDRVHQLVQFRRVAQLNLDEPAVAVRIVVNNLRLIGDACVCVDDLATQRREQLRHRFHRLDFAELCIALEYPPDLGQIQVDNVSKLRLRMLRNADRRRICVESHPLMRLAILQALWRRWHLFYSSQPCCRYTNGMLGRFRKKRFGLQAAISSVRSSQGSACRESQWRHVRL